MRSYTVPGEVLGYFNLITLLSRTLRAHVLRYARYSRTRKEYNGSTRTSRARRMLRRGTMSDFHHFARSHDGLSPYPHYTPRPKKTSQPVFAGPLDDVQMGCHFVLI